MSVHLLGRKSMIVGTSISITRSVHVFTARYELNTINKTPVNKIRSIYALSIGLLQNFTL